MKITTEHVRNPTDCVSINTVDFYFFQNEETKGRDTQTLKEKPFEILKFKLKTLCIFGYTVYISVNYVYNSKLLRTENSLNK